MRLRILLPLLTLVAACSGGGAGTESKPQVLAAAYPFAWVAQQVAGGDAQVSNLVEGGGEPHDIELTPRQVQAIAGAELLVYFTGFQPAVDDAVRDTAEDARLDLRAVSDPQPLSSDLEDETGSGIDPHVWLDPLRMQRMAEEVGRRLAAIDPDHAEGYRERAAATVRELAALHTELEAKLGSCERRQVVTAHTAFAYLADRYKLEQVGVAGLDPEAEPSPGRLAKVATFARERGVKTIFFESLVDPKLAETVAREVGAKTAVLDPVEGVSGDDDYLSVMRRNGAALAEALGCR